ncbi:MAG TPA: class I SAM-dependent methyltransferase [Gemmatimonadales bacterium]|nr:class I SAM-dependent methyltransferase [Gemmatimonadales bacterium]
MGRLIAAVYDRLTRSSEAACLQQWRAGLLTDLSGRVLEVGAGTGVNVPHYPTTLSRLVLSEPDPHMRRKLAQQVRALGYDRAEIVDAALEQLPLPADAFDAVVATLVLCSVSDLERALSEIYRVLRPGGRFVFLEHVAAETRPRRLRWQRRVEPVWRRISGNCHLTRRTEAAIERAGFAIADITRESMRKAWSLVRPTIRGVALKPAPGAARP